jgi:hypothetical protein
MAEVMGYLAKCSIGGTQVEFVSQSIAQSIELVQDDGLRGTRTRVMERVALGNIGISGDIVLQPTPAEFAAVMSYGLNSTSATYTLSDPLADVTVIFDLGAGNPLLTYTGRFNTMKFEGGPGEKIKLTIGFVGKTLVIGNGGAIGGSPPTSQRPFMFYDASSGVTIGGSTYSIDKFELTFDNKISPTYMQGQTATDLEPTDRVVTLGLQTKYTSTEAGLLTTGITGPVIGSPQTASISFTNGSDSLAFSFAALVLTPKSVTVPGRTHLRLPLEYTCYGVSASSAKEVVTTIN